MKGFERIILKPGEKKTVVFAITPEMVSIVNVDMHRVVDPGEFDLMVGPSSDNTSTVKLPVTGALGETGRPAPPPPPSGSEVSLVSSFDEGTTSAAYGSWIAAKRLYERRQIDLIHFGRQPRRRQHQTRP